MSFLSSRVPRAPQTSVWRGVAAVVSLVQPLKKEGLRLSSIQPACHLPPLAPGGGRGWVLGLPIRSRVVSRPLYARGQGLTRTSPGWGEAGGRGCAHPREASLMGGGFPDTRGAGVAGGPSFAMPASVTCVEARGCPQPRGLQTPSVKDQLINIVGFVDGLVSAVTLSLCCECSLGQPIRE